MRAKLLIKSLLMAFILGFLSLDVAVPKANACAIQVTDTTATGMIPNGCFQADFRYQAIKISKSEIVKSGNPAVKNSYSLEATISVNEPNKIETLSIVPFHYNKEVNRFDGDDVCASIRSMNAQSNPELFANFSSDGQRKTYIFILEGNVGNGCEIGDIYFAVRPSISSSQTGANIRGKTLPGNKLSIKPVEKYEGALCESNERGKIINNPDGSIWICVSKNLGTGLFKWQLVTGNSPVSVLNCMMKCSSVTIYPKQGNSQSNVSNPQTRTPIPISSNSAISCSKPGQIKKVGSNQFACVLNGKNLEWMPLSGLSNPVPTRTTSEADRLAVSGCKSFPSAIVRLQNSSGLSYNPAFIAAQEAAFNISQAGRLDVKYQVLSNAQSIIIEYAQAVGWGGKGYYGDINIVKTALATFNSTCGSKLSLK